MNTVHVRVGVHRTAYHTDPQCPSLNGKEDTFKGIVPMPKSMAEEQNLKACGHCERLDGRH